MTDDEHKEHLALQNELQEKSRAWRANGREPKHGTEARLNANEQKIEMAQAQAEMRHLLNGKFNDPAKRMTAATIATEGRPLSSRQLADTIEQAEKTRKSSMYAAAASLQGLGR